MSRRVASLGLFACLALAAASAAQDGAGSTLARARSLLEQERAAEARSLLEPLANATPPSAEALFLLSNAHFVLGDAAAGRLALERSLEMEPDLRDGWITLGALDLAEGRLEEALASFRRAQELDPAADDNLVNLGATYILLGDLANASRHFNGYLTERRSDGMAYYLVAKNYAVGEYWELTVQHLQAAIQLDETLRRAARQDPTFLGAATYPSFVALMATDGYRPVAGSHVRTEQFSGTYDGGHGVLLRGALNALQFSGRPFDPNVEVTDQWALIWAEARMKLANDTATNNTGGGRIDFSAPPTAFGSAADWNRWVDELSREIREQVAVLSMNRQ